MPRENGRKPNMQVEFTGGRSTNRRVSGVEQCSPRLRIQGPYPESAVQHSVGKVIHLNFATVEMQFDPGREVSGPISTTLTRSVNEGWETHVSTGQSANPPVDGNPILRVWNTCHTHTLLPTRERGRDYGMMWMCSAPLAVVLVPTLWPTI